MYIMRLGNGVGCIMHIFFVAYELVTIFTTDGVLYCTLTYMNIVIIFSK